MDGQQLDLVRTRLLGYAVDHGTWMGVPDVVGRLGRRTGQRIPLESVSGVVEQQVRPCVAGRWPGPDANGSA